MQEIGKEVVRKLKIIPAQAVVVEHVYYAYACRRCEREDIETPVTTAARKKSVSRGSVATAEAIAYIMVQKFVMGSSLYRQEQELKRQGITLSRQTMSNWILRAAADYLMPVFNALQAELLCCEVLRADDTTLQGCTSREKTSVGELHVAVSDRRAQQRWHKGTSHCAHYSPKSPQGQRDERPEKPEDLFAELPAGWSVGDQQQSCRT